MNAMSLLKLVRYWTRGPERPPVGQPAARIEVLTASGRKTTLTKTSGPRTPRHDATDQGPRR